MAKFRFVYAFTFALFPALIISANLALAHDEDDTDNPAPGHSTHGEAFDDGPRQAARLMPGVASMPFNATSKSEEAKKFIDQGIAQLHGFWYWEAERSFRQAAQLDPECAIAYWGMAMSNTNNETRATGFIRTAVKHRAGASPREQQYIDILSNYYESIDKEKKANKPADPKKPEAKPEPAKAAEETKAEPAKEAKAADAAKKPEADKAKPEQNCDPDSTCEVKEPKDQADLATKEADLNRRLEELKKQESLLKQKADATAKQEEALKQKAAIAAKQEVDYKRRSEAIAKKELDAKRAAADTARKDAKKNRYMERQKGWEKLVIEFPDDVHARAFYVLSFWEDRNTVPIQSYEAVDAMLDQIFLADPNHPAQHYRVHLWDEKRPLSALPAANNCGQTAPGIAHMWHMSGHTYSKLKRFQDTMFHQEAAARVDHAYMMTDRIMPYLIHNYAHNNEWSIRTMQTVGHGSDALALAKNMLAIPRHPKSNKPLDKGSVAGYGRERFYEVTTKFELWPELLKLSDTTYLRDPDLSEVEEIRRRRYWGVAAAALKNESVVAEQIAWFEKLEKELQPVPESKPAQTATKAEATPMDKKPGTSCVILSDTAKKIAQDTQPVKTRSKKDQDDLKRRITESLNHIRGMTAQTAGDSKKALELLKKVGTLPKEQLARAYSLASEHDQAVKTARDAVKSAEHAVLARAALVDALWTKGDREEAGKEFQQLRTLACTADVDLAAFTRLGEVMNDQESQPDWRAKYEVAKDAAKRPALDSLGPLCWSPATAPNWELANHEGKIHSLGTDFHGQPVVVIFYLGHGCLHCVEQLQSFAPMAKEFEAAGIKIVGISTDKPEKLKESVKLFTAAEGAFPIPLYTDSAHDAFKAYRCFDDFEKVALHGTFLIDAQGRIRWQDIGPEPFNDPKFLLKESQRLLGLPE